MSWNSSLASNYVASFRPVAPVDGFTPSSVFTNTLGSIPALNLQAGVQMANQALAELGANKRSADTLAYNKAVNRANLLTSLTGGLRLAGQALMGSGLNLAGLGLPAVQDPRQAQIDQENYNRTMAGNRAARTTRSGAAAATALRTVG